LSKKRELEFPNYDDLYKGKTLVIDIKNSPESFIAVNTHPDISFEEKVILLLERKTPHNHIELLLDLIFNEQNRELVASFEQIEFKLKNYDSLKSIKLDPKKLRSDILTAINEKDIVQAINCTLILVFYFPDNYQGAAMLGKLCDTLGMKNLAVEWFMKAYHLNPYYWYD